MTFSARKYLRLCWREGWGDWHRCFKHFLEYTYFSRLVKSFIIRILQPFLCFVLFCFFSLGFIRYSLLLTVLLCLLTLGAYTSFRSLDHSKIWAIFMRTFWKYFETKGPFECKLFAFLSCARAYICQRIVRTLTCEHKIWGKFVTLEAQFNYFSCV